MDLTAIMYLHKMFNLAKDWGVKVVNQKPQKIQKEPENRFLAQFQAFLRIK